jgi:uroporphyrinogen-III synthase
LDGPLPLAGTRVVVTRAAHQAEGLARLLREAGAEVAFLPLLEVVPPADPRPLDRACATLERFAWVVFTSANAVSPVLERRPPPWPQGVQVAAVGEATREALTARGLVVDVVPRDKRAEGLVEELASRLRPGEVVLLPQATDARPALREGLSGRGFAVEATPAYAKQLPGGALGELAALLEAGPLGWVTLTSPSTARRLRELLGGSWAEELPGLRAASIGPVTSQALRALGLEPAAEAAEPSEQALVAAICAVERRRRGERRGSR